jgi:acetyl-CoA carboxylase alpha subunit
MQINSVSDFRKAVRNGKYAWPGGYPLFFICDDGGALCCDCVKTERRNILESVAHNHKDGWKVAALDINYEDTGLHCDHCSKQIESAYGE